MTNKISVLDCTLRDGGYINDWQFGYSVIEDIIKSLEEANIDIVEVGFLRNEQTNNDRSVWSAIKQIKPLLTNRENHAVKFSAMSLHNNYDISNLTEREENGIDIIRVTFHNYDIDEGLEYCKAVKAKGYLVSCNPINIMGYSDAEVLEIIEKVNQIGVYAFSIVDTFGSMDNKDLDRLIDIVDHNLNHEITLGLHLHENKAQSFSLAQRFCEKHLSRETIIDASLLGMGRTPGNLCVELITDYLNKNFSANYQIDYLLDLIETYIEPLKEKNPWGYSPAYFLSAVYNLHRNYAEFYIKKGNLTHKDINHLLNQIKENKKAVFDKEYADELYSLYMNHEINDEDTIEELRREFNGKEVLLLAPGNSLITKSAQIRKYYETNRPLTVSINYQFEKENVDFVLYTNSKRYTKMLRHDLDTKVIITSNLCGKANYTVNYNKLEKTCKQGSNSLILALSLLKKLGVEKIIIAGADGYADNEDNYCDKRLISYVKHNVSFNEEVQNAIQKVGVNVKFLTPSKYDI